MGEDYLRRRHRLARERLRADQNFRRKDTQRAHSMFRERVKIAELSSTIGQLTRRERSGRLNDLLERIAAAKAEAVNRIDACPFGMFSSRKHEWRQALDNIKVTADGSAQAFKKLLARVKACREAQEQGVPGKLVASLDALDASFEPFDASQRALLKAKLYLVEMQLDKLVTLSEDWQKA